MSVTQYIGARYVPLFADPLTWDITKAYEALTIVYYQGNSFTSRQAVPAGIDITNTDYWALTGNYNAQIEQYRAEVQTYDNRITANTASNTAQDAQLAGTSSSGLKTLIDANTASNTAQDAQLAGTSGSGLKTLIDANTASNTTQDAQLAGTSSSGLKTLIDANTTALTSVQADAEEALSLGQDPYHMVFLGDSWGSQYSGQLPTFLANILGCELHSYARAGMGFVQGDYNFTAQAQAAAAATSYDHNLVKYVVMLGGSNDWSHDITNGATIASAINNAAAVLRTAFPRAEIHVFFNWRWKAGNVVYHKLNGQIKCFNAAAQQCGYNNYPVICHPDSLSWLAKAYFNVEDMVHPTENGNRYFSQLMASAMAGSGLNPWRTNNTVINLNGYEGVSGNLYMTFDDREVWVEAYLNVTAEVTGSHVVKQDVDLLPVQLFANPNVASNANCLGVPLVKTNGQGSANLPIKFYTSESGVDQVFLTPQNIGDTVPTGYYTGFARMRYFD